MSVVDARESLTKAGAAAGVFPLPLTNLESFMIADSRDRYPMMCDFELQFQGCIDRAKFESAVAFAIARNPLFAARVETAHRGQLIWVPTERMPRITWEALDGSLDDRYNAPTNFIDDVGLRIWAFAGLERSRVLLHFHHACSDAIGTFAFLDDLMSSYARAFPEGQDIESRSVEPHRLLGRDEIGLTGRSPLRVITDTLAGAREGLKFFLQSPVPLAAAAGAPRDPTAPAVRPAFLTAQVTQEMAQCLRRLATDHGATLNDLLMRELFVLLRDWNTAQGHAPGRRNLRILMPQNLRRRGDGLMPAANLISFAFVTRRATWCDDPAGLLRSISEETEAIRRGQLSLYFTGGLGSVRNAGLLPRVLDRNLCFATAILTNLGHPFRHLVTPFPRVAGGLAVGNLVFESVVGVPPARPNTHAAFAVVNNGPTLSISLKWDPHHLAATDARRLLDAYLLQLQATCGASPAHSAN